MITMLLWAIVFFVSAIISAIFAFPLNVSMAIIISKILFFIFSVLSISFLILGITKKRKGIIL